MDERPPIERGLFREAEDGTTVFFPWGLSGRGYALRTEADRARAARAGKLLMGVSMGIAAWAAQALEPLGEGTEPAGLFEVLRALAAPTAALAAAMVAYALWAWRFVEPFPESSLRVSREDRLREAAKLVPPWKLALIGAAVTAMSALLLWLARPVWWMAALGIAVGLGILAWAAALRRAAATPAQGGLPEPYC